MDDLVATGFCAVEVDRAGFADRGASLSSEFTALLGKPISTTADGRLVAWDLRQAREALTARVGVGQVTATGDLVLHPVLVYSDQGAYTVQQDNQTPYQWTAMQRREYFHYAPGGSTQKVDVSGGSTKRVQLVVNALPGRNPVTITITGTAASAPNVSGKIVFGKLIDVQAYVSDPRIHVGVLQGFERLVQAGADVGLEVADPGPVCRNTATSGVPTLAPTGLLTRPAVGSGKTGMAGLG